MTGAELIKLIIMTMGGKGGVGKTTFATALAEWLQNERIPVCLLDLDQENRTQGGLQYYYREATKVDVHARDGLEVFIDTVDRAEKVVIADMGAGQGAAAAKWFKEAYRDAHGMGLRFVAVGVVNNDPASVSSVLQWAAALQDQVRYWIVLNEGVEPGSDFAYWFHSEKAQEFCARFHPAVIRMASRSTTLQGHISDHGLSLGSVAARCTNVPELNQARYVAQAQRYRRQLFEEIARVLPEFLPAV